MERLGVLTSIAVAGTMLAGCSPQSRSWWNGTFVNLPPPPPEARLQLGVSTEGDGTVFINYVVWNKDTTNFSRKDIHYTTAGVVAHRQSFRQAGGYEQVIHDGEVLYGGAIVDQGRGRILLQSGMFIDGPTGNVMSSAGHLVKTYGGGAASH